MVQAVRTSLLRPYIYQAAKERNDMLDEVLWKVCVERIKIEPRIGCDDGEDVSESTSLIEDVDVMVIDNAKIEMRKEMKKQEWFEMKSGDERKKRNDMLDELLWKVCLERIKIES
ncbi:unnamed protein product, partial [Mesorhabditis belari]|uniref:Uncharacterized protein n=1 Tax=Mesorhabditis belari TaxID=2138241 RepID=A0AAF3EL26_9BILA